MHPCCRRTPNQWSYHEAQPIKNRLTWVRIPSRGGGHRGCMQQRVRVMHQHVPATRNANGQITLQHNTSIACCLGCCGQLHMQVVLHEVPEPHCVGVDAAGGRQLLHLLLYSQQHHQHDRVSSVSTGWNDYQYPHTSSDSDPHDWLLCSECGPYHVGGGHVAPVTRIR